MRQNVYDLSRSKLFLSLSQTTSDKLKQKDLIVEAIAGRGVGCL